MEQPDKQVPVRTPEPEPTPEPTPGFIKITMPLESILNGIPLSLSFRSGGETIHGASVWMQSNLDGEIELYYPEKSGLHIFATHTTSRITAECMDEIIKSSRRQCKIRHINERAIDERRRAIIIWNKMRDRTVTRLTERRGIPPPQPVLDAAMALNYFAIEKLEWAGSHYCIPNYNGMYVGIEDDGYTHT